MIVEISKRSGCIGSMATFFKALGDPNRLAILEILRRTCGDACEVSEGSAARTVTEIASELKIGLSTVSHHLKELRRAGVIQCERRGRRVSCSIDTAALDEAARFLGASL